MIQFFKTINDSGFQDLNVKLKRLVADPVKQKGI
jgi:hypothetical protein